MRPQQRGRAYGLAASLVVVAAGETLAQDAAPSEREKQLERRVEEMQKQVDELSRRLGDGSNRAGDELTQRVDELERITKKDKDGLFGSWGDGIRMDSASGAFKLKLGGRIQDDWSWFSGRSDAEEATLNGKALGQIEAGEEFRRARLYTGGTIYRNVDFMAEYDFAGGAAAPRNVWIALKNLPFGTLQVGSMKEPTGTEELTDDLFIPFLERSSAEEAFAPTFKTGVMASDAIGGNAGSWQLGVFRDSAITTGNDTGNDRSGEYNVTGRVAGRPWVDDDGSEYVHLGLAASLRTPSDDMVQFRAHPELHLAPRFVDTGAFAADRETLVVADAGFVSGPFWAFGDFYDVSADRVGSSSVNFDAWQLAVGCFLTGETKPYNAANSSFGRVRPKSNFDGADGTGAWEVVARIDGLDLDDRNVEGGKLKTFTLGVSWYLNPNTRWMLDWVHTRQRDLRVSIDGLEMRFQIDF